VVAPPAAAKAVVVVLGPRERVEQLGGLHELAELVDEHPGPLLVGEQEAEALVLVDHGLELADRRRVVHDHLVPDGHGEFDHVPEVVGGAGEERDASRLRAVDARSQVLLHPLQVGGDRSVAAVLRVCLSEQHLGRPDDVLEADVLPAVDVQVDARDRGIQPLERCKGSDVVLGDGDHGTS
jgi:hypothetical protein